MEKDAGKGQAAGARPGAALIEECERLLESPVITGDEQRQLGNIMRDLRLGSPATIVTRSRVEAIALRVRAMG